MKNPTTKFISILLSTLASLNVLSPIMALENNETLEEVRVKRVNKKNKLVVKFCNKMKDYKGFVEVDNQKFQINEADVIKPRKIVWKDVDLPIQRGKSISTDNLIARYYDDKDNSEPLTVLSDGECGVGILPLFILGAGIAAGAGSGGGSGSTSSN